MSMSSLLYEFIGIGISEKQIHFVLIIFGVEEDSGSTLI